MGHGANGDVASWPAAPIGRGDDWGRASVSFGEAW